MDIALCYPHVRPERGGCETYIADISRRFVRDGHAVHLYACDWDESALPGRMHFHRVAVGKTLRFLKPWKFARECERMLAQTYHDVSIGFDKTWGQDVLYPQGGLHTASAVHNRLKFRGRISRSLADVAKWLSPAAWSFARLERRQYLGPDRPTVIVNSHMVRGHFNQYLGIDPARVVRSAIDPIRFHADDRLRIRERTRQEIGVAEGETLGLFVAMNYRLKGLDPLIRAAALVPASAGLKIAVVGHRKDGRYRRLAEKLGVAERIHFLGFRREPRDEFFAADFLVHPTFYDPCSLVVLEALACGLPVITSRHNGASELLSPPTDGLVIDDPHDSAAFADAMQSMCDPVILRNRARAARVTGTRWTFEDHYRELMAVLESVAAVKRAA